MTSPILALKINFMTQEEQIKHKVIKNKTVFQYKYFHVHEKFVIAENPTLTLVGLGPIDSFVLFHLQMQR